MPFDIDNRSARDVQRSALNAQFEKVKSAMTAPEISLKAFIRRLGQLVLALKVFEDAPGLTSAVVDASALTRRLAAIMHDFNLALKNNQDPDTRTFDSRDYPEETIQADIVLHDASQAISGFRP